MNKKTLLIKEMMSNPIQWILFSELFASNSFIPIQIRGVWKWHTILRFLNVHYRNFLNCSYYQNLYFRSYAFCPQHENQLATLAVVYKFHSLKLFCKSEIWTNDKLTGFWHYNQNHCGCPKHNFLFLFDSH